ncbi:MAG: tRNA dihydrouridine synthase DusB [Bacteroidota bacterium]|nr:tRNA dihydrouridine synthase DusB [Bacteroidota bacterium]
MVKIGNIELPEFPLLLAPMEDVSDPPFRVVCKENGVDLMYTEFISSEGLIRNAAKSVHKLDIFPEERPIGIQIFGDKVDVMREAGKIANDAQPELVDINFGCPVKNVACRGAGAGLLKDLPKMQQITAEIVKMCDRPVTVKTRLGWDESTINVFECVQRLQDVGVAAITIHARTRAQMYKGQANWNYLAEIKNRGLLNIPLFGNGDIDSPQKALEYKNLYGVDGIMIGRAAIGYPWLFREIKHYFETGTELAPPTMHERVAACKKHLEKSIQWKGPKLGVFEMRRHYTNYFRGLPNFKEHRMILVQEENPEILFEKLEEVDFLYKDYIFTKVVPFLEQEVAIDNCAY